MPVRRHEPIFVPTRSSKYDTHHDYGIDDTINRADYLSNAVLQDTYEAARNSRGKDHALLRNLNAAIRVPSRSPDSSPARTGRPTKRYQPLSPVDIKPISSSTAVVPYRNIEKMKSALSSSPSPSSLLSSRINSYLRGSSAIPHSTRDNFLYKTLLPTRSSSNDAASQFSYRPYLSDPTPTSTYYSTPSHEHRSRTLTSSYRSPSPFLARARASSYDNDYLDNDDYDDYESETGYRRKYKIITSPVGSPLGSGVRRIGDTAINYRRSVSPDGSDVEDDYGDRSDRYSTYSCPRPSGAPLLKLSSYDGSYDGTYEADMAEMYDYVPFSPSRHGFLEFTRHDDNNLPSSYLASSSLRSSSPPPSSYTSLSVFPRPSSHLDESAIKPYKSNTLLDSIVSSTAARARQVLQDSKLPDYKHASLLLSVEGSAVSEDGKNRYGFRYYPPPIPLKGSHIGLDERILGISPKSYSPADSFLSSYLNKLSGIRSEVRDHVERGDYARGRSVVAANKPTYSHSTVHLPVDIGGRAHSVPVSSYRSRLNDGQSHRFDVFPLVVSEATLPSDKKLHLPYYKAGVDTSGSPTRLTVLEKINIKAAIIGSRMDSADGGRSQRRPRSDYATSKLRELRREDAERKYQ
jgi:hypothetical protein